MLPLVAENGKYAAAYYFETTCIAVIKNPMYLGPHSMPTLGLVWAVPLGPHSLCGQPPCTLWAYCETTGHTMDILWAQI